MKIIKTRKIQISFLMNEKENLLKIKKLQKDCRILANHITTLYQQDFNTQWLKYLNNENRDKHFNYIHNKNLAYNFSKFKKNDITSPFRLGISTFVESKIKNDWKDVVKGEKIFSTYKSNLPLYFAAQSTTKALNFLLNEKKDFLLSIGGFDFVTYLGKDKSNNRVILEKIKNKEYKFCDSSISIDGNKLFLNLVFSFEKENKILLDENKVLGVDMGIQNPLVCSISNSLERLYIGTNDIINKRYSFRKRRKNISIMLADSTVSGHGRKRKLEKLDSLGKKEKNFVNTLFHVYAKQVVDFAIKNNCGVIHLEDLSGIGKTNKILNNNWGYYGQQEKIIEKSKYYGIKVLLVNPKNTSITCSECGHVGSENRTTQAKFKCINCNYEENADYNASKNIAKSKNFSQKLNKKTLSLNKERVL